MANVTLIKNNKLTTAQRMEIKSYPMLLEEKLGIKYNYNVSVKGLFDPKQTHALHGIQETHEEYWHEQLKLAGAKNLRKVKTSYGLIILCFNAKEMIDNFIVTDSY